MDKPIIEVQNLSKLYRLGTIGASTLRESLERMWLRRRASKNGSVAPAAPTLGLPVAQHGPEPNTFWALKDVSFAIRPGEVVGIIGHNGAGKSTLLKILSRITEPTRGRAVLRGRVASLLEVGTGFHPELTGRENIFLNGAMLGMRKAEIAAKFDEIVAFAEVHEFVDTPVKRYSSGMYVRLAFAVAAHLEPEILLVDEVLAVGDAAFQKKCLGKMDDVARHGRTVVVVSHNMASVQSLCQRVILLNAGGVMLDAPARAAISRYLELTQSQDVVALDQRLDREGDGYARMTQLRIENAAGGSVIRSGSRFRVSIDYKANGPVRHPRIAVTVYDYAGPGLFLFDTEAVGGLPDPLPPEGTLTCVTEPMNLTPGRCFLNIVLYRGTAMADHVQNAAYFDIEPEDIYGSGRIPPRDWVVGLLQHQWSFVEK
ncbi:MAG: ABC transporter ATP-binding protein [Chthoniobacteraceae bacterium]